MKILCVLLEFPNWTMARSWSYTTSYAVLDGLENIGHDVTLLPSLYGTAPSEPTSWMTHADSLFKNEKFDLAWVWITHNFYPPEFWAWLESRAPIRIGMVMESMTATCEEIEQLPHLSERKALVMRDLKNCTHAVLCDEFDTQAVEAELKIPAAWFPSIVPEAHIRPLDPPNKTQATFIGSANYTIRRSLLQHPILEKLIAKPKMPEQETALPASFDALQAAISSLMANSPPTHADWKNYCDNLRKIRRNLFELTLDAHRTGGVSVNLPSYFKSYPGRVVEAIAAGVPIISCEIEDRPRCTKLFAEHQDILFFNKNDPLSLAECVKELISDRDHASRQTSSARIKLYAMHTAEYRMAQFMRWIFEGITPNYETPPGPIASIDDCHYYQQLFVNNKHWSTLQPNTDETSRWKVIKTHLDSITAEKRGHRRILDLGCGRGWLSNLLSEYGQVLGCDLVPEVIGQAKQNFPSVTFSVATAEKLLALGLQEAFDILVTSEVIEHIPAPAKAGFIQAVKALVKPGGHVIVSTPRANIKDTWELTYGKPNQPVEDWLTEAELGAFFSDFSKLGPKYAYLLDIYQIWLFQKPDLSRKIQSNESHKFLLN